jgi:ABC-type siderophore export system fused ATPase/permease subunit
MSAPERHDHIKLLDDIPDEAILKNLHGLLRASATGKKARLSKEFDEKKMTTVFSNLILFLKSHHKGTTGLKAAIQALPIKDSKKRAIEKIAMENFEEIQKSLNENQVNTECEYSDLDWRYDIELSSRGKNTEFKPNYYVKLKLKEGEKEAFIDFNADYGNLKNMTEELERVGDYMKSISYRKLSMPFKKMK